MSLVAPHASSTGCLFVLKTLSIGKEPLDEANPLFLIEMIGWN
jgi:hypothetical protein